MEHGVDYRQRLANSRPSGIVRDARRTSAGMLASVRWHDLPASMAGVLSNGDGLGTWACFGPSRPADVARSQGLGAGAASRAPLADRRAEQETFRRNDQLLGWRWRLRREKALTNRACGMSTSRYHITASQIGNSSGLRLPAAFYRDHPQFQGASG